MRKLLVFIVITIFLTAKVHSQNFSNKGKDFWLGYGYHCQMVTNTGLPQASGGSQEMVLYFTSDKDAKVTIEIPALNYTQNVTVLANQVAESLPIPKSGAFDAKIIDTGIYNRGIHVYSDQDIVAYAHIYNGSISGATLLFPTNTLGKEYYSINYNQITNQVFSNSFVFIVAVEDNTVVEITPSALNKNGKSVNVPFTVALNKGQIYNFMGTTAGNSGTDLTGTKIRTISAGGSCKKIAVFSGSGKVSIGNTQSGSADNLFAQSLPASAWGLKYLTAPTGTQPNNYYRICVSDPTTIVKLNGTIIPSARLQNSFFYELKNNNVLSIPGDGRSFANTTSGVFNLIEADKPITVAQYCTTQGQDGNPSPGDPEMIYLSPIEQTINKITLNSTRYNAITVHGINVIIGKGGISSFKLDGVSRSSDFKTHPQDPNYMYAIFPVNQGAHSIYSDTGFNAIAYGFGSAESYGYNAGTNVKDLYQPIFQNPFARIDFAATCVGTPFKFSVPLSFQPSSLSWDFGNNPDLVPNNKIGPISNPTFDSSSVIGGKNLFYYSPNQSYTFSKPGNDTVRLFTTNPSPDGCGSSDAEFVIPITVNPLPNSYFVVPSDRCLQSAIQFTDSTFSLGSSNVVNGIWNFGDGTNDLLQKNPTHTFINPGIYNINYKSITDFGCSGDTTIKFEISSIPVPKFGISDTTCVNKSITFTDSSTIAVGTIVKWYWDYGNGVKDTVNSNVSRTQTYTTGGLKTVSLIVENNTGCKSTAFTKSFFVGAYPNVNFGFPTVICLPNAITNFSDSTLFTDNIVTNATYSWNFGDGGIDSIKNPIHKYNTVGPFNVQLQVASQYGCVSSTSKIVNSIYAQPKAKFSVSPEVCLRDSTSFIDSSDGMGATVSQWRWNFGDGSAINTTQNPKHLFTSIGTKAVQLFVLTSVGCLSDTISLSTVVNPLPVSDFTFNASFYCEQRPVDFVSTSSSSVSTIQRWNWQMGDGRSIDTINGNQFSHTYAAYKSYTVGLMVENAKGCKSDTVKKVVTVYPLPQVGFIVPEICLADASAQFMDTSKIADGTESQFTYSWNLNASNITPTISNVSALNIKNPSAKYNKSDVYSIQSTVTSNRGCAVSKTQLFTVNGSIPVSKFSVLQPTMLCSNDTVRIQDISTVDFGNITRVEIYWDNINQPSVKEVDDNPTSKDGFSGKIYSHQYSNFQQPPLSKTYQVRFVAYSGGNSCVSSSEQIITVHAAPQVRFTTLPGICNDTTSRMITQASEVSNISGSYAFSGVGVNSVGVFNPRIVASGTYPIQYKYTSVAGCSDSATQNITVWPSPTAKWGISDTTCERNSFRITDSSVANYSNITRWEWNYGNGSTSIKNSGQPYLYQYATANNYNVSLRVITDSGCRSTYNSQVVRIHPLPQISFTLPNICLPDGNGTFTSTSTIADNSDALFRYRWNFNDPNDATGGTSKIQQHRYTALAPTGGYAVQLKIESKDNCIDSLTQQFTKVYPQPKTAFDIRDTSVCMGDTIYFTDRTDGKSSTVQQWYWNLAQGNTARVQNPQRAFKDSGVYTISLYSYNGEGCVSDTVSQTVVVHPYPQLELGKNLFVLEGGTITLQPQFYYGKQLSYRWTPNLYLNSDTVVAPQSTPAIFLDSIIYKLTLTGIGGCAVSDSLVLTILHPPKVPNAFSPNGDGINDTWQIKYIDSYPGAEVSVFNRYGQMVYQVTGYRNSNGWNGNTKSGEVLPVGTYYYIINPKNGRQPINGSVTIIR